MKSFKLIAGLLAGAALLTTGCKEEFNGGEDASLATPTDLGFITLTSKDAGDTLAFRWNAQEYIAKGATSFSVEICDDPAEPVNTYDDVIQTIKSSEIKDGTGVVYFTKGISEYTEKYARIRANYGAKFSKWAFGCNDKNQPAVFIAGHGIKDTEKPSVGIISVSDCPKDGDNFTVKADVSPVSSASRIIAILMDYAAQKSLQSFEVDPSKGTFEHKFEGLTSGKLYQFKMVAEYDVEGQPTHVSDWSLAEGEALDEETGETKTTSVIQCGKGLVVVNGVPPTVKLVEKYSGQLVFQWTEFGFENTAKDAAIPVKVALYKDAACKDLVYGWTIQKYTLDGKQPTMAFSNLTPGTKYWFVCQDLNTGLISDALEVKTADFNIVTVGAEKVKEKGTVVAEDCGELYFGGYAMNFSPSPTNNNNGFSHPKEGEWDSATLGWTDGNHGFFNTLGSKGGVQSSRFKNWGVVHGLKDGTGAAVPGDLCIRTGMFQMGASSGIPILCTPELTNLQGLATLKVTFTASSMWEKGAMKEASDADFKNIAVYVVSGGKTDYSTSTSYGSITGATVKEAAVVPRPATDVKEPTWETKTVRVKNVSPGSRIGIGAVRGKTGNQRWLLNMVKVEVESYGVPELFTPVMVSNEIGKTKAKFVFESQEMAQSYELGYKKVGDEEYKTVESDTPEFEIKGLNVNTDYIVRVISKAGEYTSKTPFYFEFKTGSVDYKYPLSIANTDDFVEWMTTGAEFTTNTDVVNLESDIDLKDIDSEALPIVPEFNGVLNGNNHVIKINSDHGLFRTITGEINNLTIEGSIASKPSASSEAGHPLAALAYVSSAKITNVTNKANVTLECAGVIGSPVVAGIVAFQKDGDFKNNTNEGKITLTHGGTANAAISGFNRKPFSVIGGLAGVIVNATAESCVNNGAVKVSCTDVPKVGARHYIGGVIGTPEGAIVKGCTNNGAVTGDFTDATKSAAKQVFLGGIIGGRNGDVSTADGALVEDCKNYGTCTLVAENAVNNYLGGIAGQSTIEASASFTIQKIANSHNYGKLIKKGAGGCRVGGISGGAATLDNCSNEAEISVENISSAGAVGGLVGYPTQTHHPITNCKSLGNMTSTATAAFAMGGIGGQAGNTVQTWSGCTVNCTISGQSANLVGMVVGTAQTVEKKITLGTKDAPIKVSGTINGTAISESNIKSFVSSDGKADENGVITTAKNGTLNAAYVIFGK